MTGARPFHALRGPLAAGLCVLVLLVAGTGLWAMRVQISGALVAQGRIAPAQMRHEVAHPEGGTIASLEVAEGARVRQGQVLARLDGTALRAEADLVATQLFAVRARRARLEAEQMGQSSPDFPPDLMRAAAVRPEAALQIDAQRRLARDRAASDAAEALQTHEQTVQLNHRIAGLVAESLALDRQRSLIAQELRDQQSLLDKGLSQVARVLALRREAARLDGQRGALTAQQAEAAARLEELTGAETQRAARLRAAAGLALEDLRAQEAELRGRRARLARQIDGLVLTAPFAGTVNDLRLSGVQAVLRPAAPLLTLVPDGAPPVIHAAIPPRRIDLLQPEQPVRLRLGAHDAPDLAGHVRRIPPDLTLPPGGGAPYYSVEIALDPEQGPLDLSDLRAGRPVEVFILTAPRTPLEYLSAPLMHYVSRAFRE